MEESTNVGGLLRRVLDILDQGGALTPSQDSTIIEFKHPQALKAEILDLRLRNDGLPEDELLDICEDVIRYSVKTGHPLFLNQLYRGLDPYGLAGAYISEALNTNQYTFEVAPVFTLCELEVLQRALELFGFKKGGGIFTPGGSMSNMYAMALAKHKKFPEAKRRGLSNFPPLVVFTSQDAHYSLTKSANWLGIGTDNVELIETDAKGRMLPQKLIEKLEKVAGEGKIPLMVNATAGTTVLGAFDPFEEIAEICCRYGVWLHVDACWGGSFIFSELYSPLLKGSSRADSLSWNPHKMLGAPLQCSMFLVKDKGLLHECNAAHATYLFQKDKMYDVSYDTGDMSIQCGRKVDAFKLWLMWKARGDIGFAQHVDQAMHSARYLLGRLTSTPGFRLVVHESQCTNVSFWYIPPKLRNLPETDEWWEKIDKVAPKLKEKLVLQGTMMISYQPLAHKKLKNFFRVAVTCHPPPTMEQMDFVISEIDKYGEKLEIKV